MGTMTIWTHCESGTLCTEASTLALPPGVPISRARLPDGTTGHTWVQHSREGEVTHWTLTHKGQKYEVYNT